MLREGASKPFHVLMTDTVPDYHLTADSAFLYRWRYVSSPTGTIMVSNINSEACEQFRRTYGDGSISEDDLFYYAYGVLHSQQWREKFAYDLEKTPARIPMAENVNDFREFVVAGHRLAYLHVDFESVPQYDLKEVHSPGWNPELPGAYRVAKMTYGGKQRHRDRSRIVYNAGITLAGIPGKAHNYRLGANSALDWLVECFRLKTDKKSGITNDPNDWAAETGDPHYILDLVKRVTNVSLQTVNIVESLPELPCSNSPCRSEVARPAAWSARIHEGYPVTISISTLNAGSQS